MADIDWSSIKSKEELSKAIERATADTDDEQQRNSDTAHALVTESCRGAILIIAAHVHNLLHDYLMAFAFSRASAKKLFGQGGRADSFGSHIMAAHTFGLISDDLKNDLRIIHSVRNWAAHNIDHCSWDHHEVASRVSSMLGPHSLRGEKHNEKKFVYTYAFFQGKITVRIKMLRSPPRS